jgi:uncharacterized protein (DUF305 family)
MRFKFLALVACLVVSGGVLVGCGSSHSSMSGMGSETSSSSDSGSKDFDAADVAFASDMIPHHQQAVEMAELAETRASSADVKSLAAQIKAAQGPEITTMSGWLKSWGKPVPAEMSGMDMSGSMPGMMSNKDMTTLEGSSGADFDRMFLTMMIQHHEGAIEMAKTEQSSGKSAEAIALAKKIESAQTAEIATMQKMLG